MKRIATTILFVLLVAPWARAETGCADCGAVVAPKLHCVPTCQKATAEIIQWGVVSDPVCVTHCRLLSCLPFGKSVCHCDGQGCGGQGCDGPHPSGLCVGGCDTTKPCRIRGRNRLMRKTLVEYIPVTDHVVAPICQSCLHDRLETEPIPAPEGTPVLAPLIDAAALQKNDAQTARPVHWIYTDAGPNAANLESGVAEKWLDRLAPASPLQVLTAPRTSRGPTPTFPVQR